MAEIRHAGGAVSRPPEHPNAYGNRSREHLLELVAVLPSPGENEAAGSFVTDMQGEISQFAAKGSYLNFLEGSEKLERSAEGFEPGDWERLRAIKKQYDPGNLFDHGISIS